MYVKVEDGKFDLGKIKNFGIREDDIVLFHTGLIDHYHEEGYFTDYPEMSEEIAQYLVEKKVKMVGFDSCGPDHPPHKTHKVLFGGGVLIIENLANLAELAGRNFTVYALPIKLQVDGAPARAIALLRG